MLTQTPLFSRDVPQQTVGFFEFRACTDKENNSVSQNNKSVQVIFYRHVCGCSSTMTAHELSKFVFINTFKEIGVDIRKRIQLSTFSFLERPNMPEVAETEHLYLQHLIYQHAFLLSVLYLSLLLNCQQYW